jgi:outer membrane usher protein
MGINAWPRAGCRLQEGSRWLVLVLFSVLSILTATPALGAPPDMTSLVVAVTVNGEPKGDFFIYVTEAGDHLVKVSDLESMGLRHLQGTLVELEGEPYLSLRSIAGVGRRFDEKTLTLQIGAAPELLGRKTVDLMPQRRPGVLQPRDNSAFLNYRVGYSGGNGGAASYNLAGEVGARLADWLFLTDFSHVNVIDGERRSVRLMSNLTLDRRAELQRLVLGDFFTSSGELGSTLNLGGISFSKRYAMDPYLVRQPMAGFAGAVTVPSEAEIYLDGVRVRTEKLPPGEFLIQNLNYYGGARDIQIVIKDRFGREQRVDYRYYFVDTLLKHGLHEYSYDLGLMRREFGVASDRYGGLASSAFHRYGVSDDLTLGLRGEASGGRLNLGPQAILRLGNLGITSVGLSASHDRDAGRGSAAQFSYSYQGRAFNASLLARRFSEGYAQAAPVAGGQRPRFEGSAGFGYASPAMGNFGFNYAKSTRHDADARRSVTLSYSKSLAGNLSVFATFSRVRETTSRNEVFVGLSWYPGKDINASYLMQDRAGTRSDTLQVSKNAPVGEGWGYRVAAEKQRDTAGDTMVLSPFVQYNGPYGIYTADYRSQSGDPGGHKSSYQMSMAGAIAYVGGTFGLSRPIYDSFGVVHVGGLADVRVYQNNQVIGRTDRAGTLFVPNLGAYMDNQIGIEDKDIPFEYSIAEKEKFVSPFSRSGSLIHFQVVRIQAFTGTVKIRIDGELKPVEYYEGVLLVAGKPVTFVTGKGGELYLENFQAGRYQASLSSAAGPCRFDLAIPESGETIVELGEVICEHIQ